MAHSLPTQVQIHIFTCLSILCALLLDYAAFQFWLNLRKEVKNKKNKARMGITLSAFCVTSYALFCSYEAILYLLQSMHYLTNGKHSIFSWDVCIAQAMGVIPFMSGKLSMYVMFTWRVYDNFDSSIYRVNPKKLMAITLAFLIIMAVIGTLYLTFLIDDYTLNKEMTVPSQCHLLKLSWNSHIIIMVGCLCDAAWSFTCWALFVGQLYKLVNTTLAKDPRAAARVQTFVKLILKMTVLSFICALSTLILGLSIWPIFPTFASLLNATANGLCVYLSFKFTIRLYNRLCGCFSLSQCIKCCQCCLKMNETEVAQMSQFELDTVNMDFDTTVTRTSNASNAAVPPSLASPPMTLIQECTPDPSGNADHIGVTPNGTPRDRPASAPTDAPSAMTLSSVLAIPLSIASDGDATANADATMNKKKIIISEMDIGVKSISRNGGMSSTSTITNTSTSMSVSGSGSGSASATNSNSNLRRTRRGNTDSGILYNLKLVAHHERRRTMEQLDKTINSKGETNQ